jgi:DNA-binding transcriptional LysR family regulator
VELREIEVFLVLAEELHFGRTAERLFVSQSRVSQVIRRMETRVGGRLFERTSRTVRLTPLGAELRDALGPPYEQIHEAFAAAAEVSFGIAGELRISALSFAAAGPAFADVVRAFRARHRHCDVTVYEAFPGEALQRLRRGELDMLAHWLPVEQPDLVVGPLLARAERALAVPVAHPLAERGWATVEDLADNAILDADGVVPPETLAALYPTRSPSGRPIPRRSREGRMAEVLGLVARGEVVHPTVASLPDYYTHPGVTTVPLRDLPPVESALVWSSRRETAAIRAFAEVAQQLAAPAAA